MFNSKFSIGVLKHPGYNIDFGDDTPAPQQVTTQTSNIPDWMRPYMENMLGATQQQLFNMDSNGQITGMKPYQPYSTNMNDYVAGFSPLQQQAQRSAAGLQMPGQFQQGSQFATASGLGSLGTAQTLAGAGNNYYNMATDPNSVRQFMNPYMQDVLNPQLEELRRQSQITGQQQAKAATGAGAFGGSREALMAAENNRNLGQIQNQAIGNAYNNAFQQAQNAQQFGANLGLQGNQAALQGYGQVGQAGALLGQLGTQELAAQQGIIGTQNAIGAQQTAAEQAKINQAIQDYANAQQWPMMQLGFMSNMTRGLPLNSPTTSSYQAQPSAGTQALGAIGAGISAANAAPKAAKGGIMSYDIGGAVEYDLSRMPTDKLNELKGTAQSKIEKEKINKILAERKLDDTPQFAPGGIVAFDGGGIADFLRTLAGNDAAEKDAAAEKTSEPSRPTSSNRFASLGKEPVNAAPGVNLNPEPSKISLGPDANAYMPPVRDIEVPSAGEAPKESAKIEPSLLDKLLAKRGVSGEAAPAGKSEGPSNSLEGQLQNVISQRKNIDQALADGLNNIYQDPVNAPYAKKRFDQFQEEIDNAPEKERQMFWLHSATMFATMATQPGGVIKAAMGALANQIPLYVKDKEKQDEHLEAVKKAQYDITQSEIARRVGDLKTSLELKDKALKETADIYIAINKDKQESAKLAEEKSYHKGALDINRLQAAASLIAANKPGEKERLIDRALKDPKFAEELMNQTLGPAELRSEDAAKKRYQTAKALDPDLTYADFLESEKVNSATKYAGWGNPVQH